MKKVYVLFCLFTVLFLPAFAREESSAVKKYYCSADQVELTNSMILIRWNENLFETDSLFVDQGGIYFTEDMLRCTYCRRPLNPKNTCECPIQHSFFTAKAT